MPTTSVSVEVSEAEDTRDAFISSTGVAFDFTTWAFIAL